MKVLKVSLVMLFVIGAVSFTTITKEFIANVEESTVSWKGFKPAGNHSGVISVKKGSLIMNGNQLVTGSFEISMNTIIVEDLEAGGKYNKKLVDHLKSADFFDVKQFPLAKFEISGSELSNGKTKVKGFLTIKDIRKEISFLADITTNDEGQLVLESETFKINRADFNVKYNSKSFYANLKDKVIYDDFEITVKIVSQ